MPTELVGSTHISFVGGKLAIIEVSRDDESSQPVIWLKVGTACIEYENDRATVTNFTIDFQPTPVPPDDASLRELFDSIVSNECVVSEVILAIRKLLAVARRANAPTLRSGARDSNRPTLVADEPTTTVGRPPRK